ncbi:DUF1924 domain-containing protein [Streptomyces sp. NPDC052077]|nr:DUF1924 domain-containing protein [Streptomyces sp. SHP 1-2]MYU25710.1 DUF1924 domain-containing protein [Streptomyces sp. SID8352]
MAVTTRCLSCHPRRTRRTGRRNETGRMIQATSPN